MQTEEIVKLTRQAVRDLLTSRQPLPPDKHHERRRSPRWPFPATVEIQLDDNTQTFGTCQNLNESGLGMSCDEYLEPETRLRFSVHLPEVSFYGVAVVRYCMKTPRGYMVGFEFLFPD